MLFLCIVITRLQYVADRSESITVNLTKVISLTLIVSDSDSTVVGSSILPSKCFGRAHSGYMRLGFKSSAHSHT